MSDEAPPHKLSSVPGGRSTDASRIGKRRALTEDEKVRCHKCERLTGVSTSAVVKVVVGPFRTPAGRKTGGTTIWACAFCLVQRGEITELIRA